MVATVKITPDIDVITDQAVIDALAEPIKIVGDSNIELAHFMKSLMAGIEDTTPALLRQSPFLAI